MKTKRQTVRMDFDQNMGELYPFSLGDKLQVITEPSAYYRKDAVSANPWGRAIIPIEMLSVLVQYRSREDRLPVKGPAVGLFADQEIRLLRGPLFAAEDYQTEREVVALSGSRRNRKPLAADHGLCKGWFTCREDAAEPCEPQRLLRAVCTGVRSVYAQGA